MNLKNKTVGIPITEGMWDQPESITVTDYSEGKAGEVACIFLVHFLWFPHHDAVISVRSKWDDSIAPEENWVFYVRQTREGYSSARQKDALVSFIERNKKDWNGLAKELITSHLPVC